MSVRQLSERDTRNSEAEANSTLQTDGVQMKSDEGDGDEKNQEDEPRQLGDDERETQCGIGSWRPRCLQPLANMWFFTAALCFMTLFGSANFAYYVAVITQVERRFGLSSQTTGFIKNIDNIGFMSSVLVLSHMGRYGNKPRILVISALVSAFAIFLFSTPHFIYGGPGDSLQASSTRWNASSTVERRQGGRYEVCDGVDESVADPSGCSSRNVLLDFNVGALALFVVAELLQGMANSPRPTMSLTYMDDNAKERSPIFIGVMFGMRSFAPMLGFALGAWTNSLYVDLTDPGLDKRDPRWIGAWWLGFVICAVGFAVTSLPVLLFPSKLTHADRSTTEDKDKNILTNLKDLPRACWRLLSNPLYLTLVISLSFSFSLSGYTTFLPKYLQFYFGQSASWASVYAGAAMSVSWTLGPIIGGPIATRLNQSIPRTLFVVLVVHAISCFGYLITMFLGCPEAQWLGTITQNGPVPSLACNGNCSCDPTAFTPVCGSDGRNYFSPCYAGCQNESSVAGKTEFFGCQCIEDGRATAGLCTQPCMSFYVFIVVIFVTFLCKSMMIVPIITVLLRCVDYKDKAVAVALSTCVSNLAAFPAPMMYGALIDSTCRVLQQSCTRKGACLLYDNDSLRFRFHLLPLCTQLVIVVLQVVAWHFSRRGKFANAAVDPTNEITVDGKAAAESGPDSEDGKLDSEKETAI